MSKHTFMEEAGAPATPTPAGAWVLYFKSTGLYVKDDAGNEIGPIDVANIQTLLNGVSSTRGTMLYRGASAWSALAPSTAGLPLKTGGAGADPSFGTIAEGALGLTDVTTGNRSTSAHGFGSKFPNSVLQLEYGDGNWRPFGVTKASNETINNSAVLQNDDDFLFSIGANEKWFVELFLVVTSVSANSDLKCDFTVPASCTGWFGGQGSSQHAWGTVNAATSPTALNALTSALAIGSLNGTYGVHLIAIVINSTNAGTVQFRWAQNTATAENTIINAGSFMRIARIG